MDEIRIKKTGKGLSLEIPLKSQGKFRCKNRANSSEYGEGFAPKTEAFTKNSYVEWQIGYDARVDDVRDGKKSTTLTKRSFVGANGADKYLYELSEIVWKLSEVNLISKKQIENLISEVDSYAMFLQENFQIQMKKTGTESKKSSDLCPRRHAGKILAGTLATDKRSGFPHSAGIVQP